MKIAKIHTNDIDSLIEIEKIVFPDTFNVKMGNYFLRKFFGAFTELPRYNAIVAQHNEKPIGFLLGYPYGERGLLNKYLAKAFMQALIRNPFLVVKKDVITKIIENIKNALPGRTRSETKKVFNIDYSKAYYMFLIAITPDGRGLNLGRSLMLHMQELAEKDGYKYFLGSVATENEKVLYLWNTIGYDIVDIEGNPDTKYVFKDTTKNN